MMSTALYTRVAHPRRDEGHEMQTRRAERVAEDHGLVLNGHYADTGMSRGEFLRLLDAIRSGQVDTVVAVCPLPPNIDALTRLIAAGGRLVTESTDSDDRPADLFQEQVERLLATR